MLSFRKLLWILPSIIFSQMAAAQNCYTCGSGSMGVFHATTDQSIIGGSYDYLSFTIDPGVTVTVIGNTKLLLHVRENVEINGTLIASGAKGEDGTLSTPGKGGIAVANGYNGGDGTYANGFQINGNPGTGLGAGNFGSSLSGGGGAGYASNGQSSNPIIFNGGNTYSDVKLSSTIGGSGGGSGAAAIGGSGGGGAGGGVIQIQSCNTIKIGTFGAILSDGGNGGNAINAGAGGGGSGGTIWLSAADLEIAGNISAKGGNGGFSTLPSSNFSNGGNGSEGRIRIDQIDIVNYGTIYPAIGYSEKPYIARIWRALDPACHNTATGFIKARSNGGQFPYSYLWSNGARTSFIDNIPSGTYSVTVTDGNGCTQYDQVTLSNPEKLEPQILTKKPDCIGGNNGSIFISATGGKPWPLVKNLTTTLYGTTQSKGVMFDLSVSEQIQLLKFSLSLDNFNSNDIEIWYRNGSFSGYEYDINAWMPLGTHSILGLGPDQPSNLVLPTPLDLGEGTYSFYLYNRTGSFNCVSSTTLGSVFVFDHSVSIFEGIGRDFTSGNVFNSPVNSPVNFSGKIGYQVLHPLGKKYNFDYGLTTNIQEIQNLTAGNYSIKVTDALGCEVISQVKVEDPNPVVLNQQLIKNPTCNGYTNGRIEIDASGGNLSKNIQTSFLTNHVSNGIMFSMIASQDINLENISLVVDDVSNIEIFVKQGSYIGYENNSSAWTSLGVYPIQPINGEMPISISLINSFPLTTGSWSFFIYNATSKIKSKKNVLPGSIVATSPHTSLLTGVSRLGNSSNFGTTYGTPVDFSGILGYTIGGGAFSYNWWNGFTGTTLNGLGAGSYPINITDIDGCIQHDTIVLTEPSAINSSTTSTFETDEFSDGSIGVTPSGGTPPYYYFWNPIASVSNTVNGLPAGNYSVLIVDSKGCAHYDSVSVTRYITPPVPKGNLLIVPSPSSDHILIGKEVKGMEDCKLRIFDAVGKLIYEDQTQISKLMNEGLYLGRLSDGVYHITTQDDDQIFSSKITIIK